MRNLVPLTKILLTLGTAVWAIIFREPFSLALLCVLELIILLVSNELFIVVKGQDGSGQRGKDDERHQLQMAADPIAQGALNLCP